MNVKLIRFMKVQSDINIKKNFKKCIISEDIEFSTENI